jgi:hypothetical protein
MTTSASLRNLGAGCLTALGALLFWHAASAGEAQKQPVLVELFTSQGCSSCPAADVILGEIKQRKDVVALSFNVDYWDYIGWRDTLAKHENTVRQQAYEKVLPSHRMYTPQIVVDGVQDMPGNQRQDVVEAIQRRVSGQQGKRVSVALWRCASARWPVRSLRLCGWPTRCRRVPSTSGAARTMAAQSPITTSCATFRQ